MKLKSFVKTSPDDIAIINLSYIKAIRNDPAEGLEIYSDLNNRMPASFSDDLYDFYIIEIHRDGRVHPEPAAVSILDILTAYMEA